MKWFIRAVVAASSVAAALEVAKTPRWFWPLIVLLVIVLLVGVVVALV